MYCPTVLIFLFSLMETNMCAVLMQTYSVRELSSKRLLQCNHASDFWKWCCCWNKTFLWVCSLPSWGPNMEIYSWWEASWRGLRISVQFYLFRSLIQAIWVVMWFISNERKWNVFIFITFLLELQDLFCSQLLKTG